MAVQPWGRVRMTDLRKSAPDYKDLDKGVEPIKPEGADAPSQDTEGGWRFGPDQGDNPWGEGKGPKRRTVGRGPSEGTFIFPEDFNKQIPPEEWRPSDAPEEPPEWYGEIVPLDLKADRPLILVPGIMATSLAVPPKSPVKAGYKSVWPPVNLSHTNLRDLNRLVKAQNLVPWGSGGFYTDKAVLVQGAYGGLINFIEAVLGYTFGEDFFLFGYDWTASNATTAGKLTGFIQYVLDEYYKTRPRPKHPAVDVIGHSMGGIVTRAAVNLFGAPVHRVVYIASPHYGTPKAYGYTHPNVDPIPGLFYDFILHVLERRTNLTGGGGKDVEEVLAEAALVMPSVHELLPDGYFFKYKWSSFVQEGSVVPDLIYGLDDTYYDNSTSAMPTARLKRMTRTAMQFKESLGYALPGKPYLNIPAFSGATTSRIEFPTWGDGDMVAKDAGDGTVVFASAEGPNRNYNTVYASHVAAPDSGQTHALIALFWADTK